MTMEKRTKIYERMIREGIDRAYLENILQKRKEIKLSENDYSGDFKREAKEIIDHIKDAHEEIFIIENLKESALKQVNKSINTRIDRIHVLLEDIIKNKSNKIDYLKDIVSNLIDDTGPKKDSTFLLLNIKRRKFNLIIRHSINVCLIAISIAIELTKIMTNKLNDPSVRGDFKKLSICNKKIFTKKELVDLGVAALLHDIGLLEYFPDIDENTQFDMKDRSKIELHPNNAYHLLTGLKVDYEIRKAVLQHHERIDGSGYPDSIKGRLFNKYSLVLSFANYIELLTSKNPFHKKMHAHRAIMHILKKERSQFDNDITLAYCRAASLYPIGSWIYLSNNKIGIVFKANRNNIKRPIVKCVYTSDMKELLKKEFIDLSKSSLKINELIDIESLTMLDKSIEKYIFDEREFMRITVNIEGKINIPDSSLFFKSRIKDISAGGLRLELTEPLSLGTELYIDFTIKDKKLQQIKSIIVWIDLKTNQYGLRFIDLDSNIKEFLMELS